MTSITKSDPAIVASPAPAGGWPARIGAAALLVALGDVFFYRQEPGVTAVLFALATGAILVLTNRLRLSPPAILAAFALLLLACLPGVEHLSALSLAFAYGGLTLFALAVAGPGGDQLTRPLDAMRLLASGPARLIRDGLALTRLAAESGWGRALLGPRQLAGWIVPIGLLCVFAALFADANPLIETWLRAADPAWVWRGLSPTRIAAWILLLMLVWPLLQVQLRPLPKPGEATAEAAVDLADILLGREAIARSLVLFNLLFAVQTLSDATFLWAGAALPEGMTYASYAHRGAYPLIVTALLAAGFVLAAMRPGGPAEDAPRLRALVYLFVAQNVGLVLSSILRLDLYVSVYSLTYWRVAAFVWMGLVLIGLVLIAARIALRRPNRWLIGANLLAAAAVLYLCCFVNVASLIAHYNVEHQPEETRRLDLIYLVKLGPQAIPAIDRVLPALSDSAPMIERYPRAGTRREWLRLARERLAHEHRMAMADWRRWSLRGWRLSRYLDAHPDAPDDRAPAAEASPAPVESGAPPR